ncbi:MAG: hypothetical protein HY509_02945, partial [Acidobacteria bacterium]|nr:hypothetical protein [Acidobacteriota bacterium]
ALGLQEGLVGVFPDSDDLDGLEERPPEDVAPNGVPAEPVYFSLDPASPSLPSLGAGPADILVTSGGAAPTVFASAADLGLAPEDDLDALCLWENGDGVFGAGDLLAFSLAAGSPSLFGIAAQPGDLLRPGPAVLRPGSILGLFPGDELNAVKCARMPLVDLRTTGASAAPDPVETCGAAPAAASVQATLENVSGTGATVETWWWAMAPEAVDVHWVAQAGDACYGPGDPEFPPTPVDCASPVVWGLSFPAAIPAGGSLTPMRDLLLTCNATGTYTVQIQVGQDAFEPLGTEEWDEGNNTVEFTFTVDCLAEQDLFLSTSTVLFGEVCPGASSVQSFGITNAGACTLTGAVDPATPDPPFTVVGGGGPFSLPGGALQLVDVQFSPAASDPFSGSVVITSNDPDTPTATVSLSGTGANLPGPVGDTLTLTGEGVTTLTWESAPFATDYDTYRGTRSITEPWAFNHVCFENDDSFGDGLLVSTDFDTPPLGTLFYYLVGGHNTCGPGPLGFQSNGDEEPNPSPCL